MCRRDEREASASSGAAELAPFSPSRTPSPMNPDALEIALATMVVLATILGATTLGFAVAWVRARERAARAEARAAQETAPAILPGPAPADRARLEALQQSIDAIAVEVERIGEGERFATRLLIERAAPDGERWGTVTPARGGAPR